jgi:hypothetical protein
VQRRSGRHEKRAAAREIQAVVRIAPISGTPSRRHELRRPERSEVVRDEVLGFPYQLSKLANPSVASGQVAENLPAEWVSDQLQELEGRLVDSRSDHTCHDRSNQFDTSSPFDALIVPAREDSQLRARGF